MSDKVLSQFKQEEEVEAKEVSRVFNVAIIGTGWIAGAYVNPIKELPNVKLVALADLIPGKAEKFAKKNGLDDGTLRYYPSHKELIDNEKDPQQMHNVSQDPAYADVMQDLTAKYYAARKQYRVINSRFTGI